jgi:hypothetical protein
MTGFWREDRVSKILLRCADSKSIDFNSQEAFLCGIFALELVVASEVSNGDTRNRKTSTCLNARLAVNRSWTWRAAAGERSRFPCKLKPDSGKPGYKEIKISRLAAPSFCLSA